MKLIAHRGLHTKNTRENTLPAVMLGNKNDKLAGVEFDVRLTKDNKVVVIHDEDIDRVSNGKGMVREMTLSRLKEYNFGSFFKRCSISTLNEVLDKLSGNNLIIIELKDELDKSDILASKVLEIIKNYPNLNIWLKSFSVDIVSYLRKYSTYPVGMLVRKTEPEMLNIEADFYSISYKLINSNIIKDKLFNNKMIMIWTVDTKDQLEEIKSKLGQNIDNVYIITNHPFKINK